MYAQGLTSLVSILRSSNLNAGYLCRVCNQFHSAHYVVETFKNHTE